MNIDLATAFLSGEFDPTHKQIKKKALVVRAKLFKPKTKTVKVKSDWSMDSEEKSRAVHIPRMAEIDADAVACVQMTRGGRFKVQFRHLSRLFYLGTFLTLADAVKTRDDAKARIKAGTFVYKGEAIANQSNKRPGKPPKYIQYIKRRDRYRVQRCVNGKTKSYGVFKTLEEAIVVADAIQA